MKLLYKTVGAVSLALLASCGENYKSSNNTPNIQNPQNFPNTNSTNATETVQKKRSYVLGIEVSNDLKPLIQERLAEAERKNLFDKLEAIGANLGPDGDNSLIREFSTGELDIWYTDDKRDWERNKIEVVATVGQKVFF